MNNYFGFWGQQDEIIYPLQTGLTACWSLFHRVEDYTGPSIRIRRSSDDSEQDIGFTSAGVLDVADMESFIGSSTGYVLKWYDQKDGIGTDMEPFYLNSGTQYYPVIVLSGTTQVDSDGKPSIKFGNSNYSGMFAACNNTRLINAFSGTIYYSYETSDTNSQSLGGNSNGNSTHSFILNGGTGTSSVFWDYVSPQTYRYMITGNSKVTLQGSLPSYVTSGDLYNSYQNVGKLLGAELSVGWNTLGTGHSIGGRGNGSTSEYFRGFCNEYLIYGSSQHSISQVDEILDDLAILNS